MIGVFPNDESIIRIMGSVLLEMHEASIASKIHGYPKAQLQAVDDYLPQLQAIAAVQQKLLAA